MTRGVLYADRVRRRSTFPIDAGLWALSGLLFAAILLFSFGPQRSVPTFDLSDKIRHAINYGALTGCLLLAAVWRPGRGDGNFPRAALSLMAAVVVFGVLVEIAQGLFFDRTADPIDALADAGGALAAFLAWRRLARMGAPSRRPQAP